MNRPVPVKSASALIDEKIKELGDWRGKTLAKVREIVHEADPEIVEEWKWVKPALKDLIRPAVALNLKGKSKPKPRRASSTRANYEGE